MSEILRHCDTHPDITGFKYPFPHLMRSVKLQRKIKIVAIGSSSTAGEGDLVPYPARLELLLRGKFRDRMIDVLNRGLGGQEAPSELSRFEPDVIGEGPSLVIWQVGTNAVFHNYDLDLVAADIAVGLERLRGQPMDAVQIDPQYVPAMLFDKADASERVVSLISAAANKAKVNLFQRWALMRHWHVHNNIGLDRMIDPTDPDKLHQSDWSTLRFAQALSDAITKAPPAV